MARVARFEREEAFFEVHRAGGVVTLRRGQTGEDAETNVTEEEASFGRYGNAFEFMREAIGEQVLAGFRLVGDDVFSPAPPNTEMEDAIVAGQDDEFAWDVYADWLTSHGDLRGELIALERDDSPGARARIESLVLGNEHLWLGGFYRIAYAGMRTSKSTRVRLKLEYRSGFVERAWISHGGAKLDEELPLLFGCSAMQFLRVLDVTDWNDGTAKASVIEVIAKHAPRSLGRVTLPIPPHNERPLVDPIFAALPYVEEVRAHGKLSRLVHQKLSVFSLRGSLDAKLTVDTPALTRCMVNFDSPRALKPSVIAALEQGAPALEVLALGRLSNADAIFDVVLRSRLPERLRTLQLSGDLSDRVALTAIEHAARLQRMKINLHRTNVSEAVVKHLRRAGIDALG